MTLAFKVLLQFDFDLLYFNFQGRRGGVAKFFNICTFLKYRV